MPGARRVKTLVFAGYAPVHFVCFRPYYERLRRVPGLDLFLSGGRKTETRRGTRFDARALYAPFRVPRRQILSLDRMRRRSFDMAVCAHTSGFFPRRVGTRVQIFHGLSFRNMAVRRDQRKYDALFVAGPYMMRALQRRRIFRRNDPRALPIGFAKVDRLRDGTLDRRAILKRLRLRGDRPVLLYAPTGQRHNSLERMGLDVLRRLRAARRYDILIKLHDHPRNTAVSWPDRLRPLLDRHTRLVRDYDVVPYLFAADLLITDASSVSSEYALLDRPMVFLDVPRLLNRARRRGAAVDLRTWGRRGGRVVRRAADAVEAVRSALARPRAGSAVRRAMARDLFYGPGGAAERGVAWICRRLGLPAPVRL